MIRENPDLILLLLPIKNKSVFSIQRSLPPTPGREKWLSWWDLYGSFQGCLFISLPKKIQTLRVRIKKASDRDGSRHSFQQRWHHSVSQKTVQGYIICCLMCPFEEWSFPCLSALYSLLFPAPTFQVAPSDSLAHSQPPPHLLSCLSWEPVCRFKGGQVTHTPRSASSYWSICQLISA